MSGNPIIKLSVIAGFLFGVIYCCYTVLAPNKPGKPGRTMIPLEWIPKTPTPENVQVPAGTKATRVIVGSIFMGPFGAMAGLGVGLILEQLRQLLKSLLQNKQPTDTSGK